MKVNYHGIVVNILVFLHVNKRRLSWGCLGLALVLPVPLSYIPALICGYYVTAPRCTEMALQGPAVPIPLYRAGIYLRNTLEVLLGEVLLLFWATWRDFFSDKQNLYILLITT
jgi:hypothetical protein